MRKWRENEEIERENDERMRKLKCNGEREKTWRGRKYLSLHFPILSKFSLSLSPCCLSLSIFSLPLHFLSIFSLSLHFLFIFSFSCHFLGNGFPTSLNLCRPDLVAGKKKKHVCCSHGTLMENMFPNRLLLNWNILFWSSYSLRSKYVCHSYYCAISRLILFVPILCIYTSIQEFVVGKNSGNIIFIIWLSVSEYQCLFSHI